MKKVNKTINKIKGNQSREAPGILSWKQIEKKYDKQWVQLINFDWPEYESLPHSGEVVANAKKRKDFDKLICATKQKFSAILFIGDRELPPNIILSASMHQWTSK